MNRVPKISRLCAIVIGTVLTLYCECAGADANAAVYLRPELMMESSNLFRSL